jgi:hypothetical protein
LTPPADLQITVVCQGAAEAIRAAAATWQAGIEPQPLEQGWQFTVGVSDQEQLNSLVDALRAANVSIMSIREQRPTLEDAFLQLVEKGGGQATA